MNISYCGITSRLLRFPLSKVALAGLVIALLGATFTAVLAQSSPGSIMLFVDNPPTDCDTYDIPGIITVYVWHMFYDPVDFATGVYFKVDHSSFGCILTYAGETIADPYYTWIGSSQTGIFINFNACIMGPNHILTIIYVSSGLSPDCCHIQVVDHPGTSPPGIYAVDCGELPGQMFPATGGDVIINPTPQCNCNIPVKETSWGKIKALYSK
jgi:hypothetical protein